MVAGSSRAIGSWSILGNWAICVNKGNYDVQQVLCQEWLRQNLRFARGTRSLEQLEIEAHRVLAGLPVPAFQLDNTCRGVPSGWPKALVPLANPTDSYTTRKERTES